MMDPSIAAIIGALITTLGSIIVTIIQSRNAKTKETGGLLLPPNVVIHRPHKNILWLIIIAVMGGVLGYSVAFLIAIGKTPMNTVTPTVQTTELKYTPIRSTLIVIVQDKQIEVLDGPGYSYDIIGQLKKMDEVVVVATDDQYIWFNVVLPTGGTGWIKNDDRISYTFPTEKIPKLMISTTPTASPPQEIILNKVQEINLPQEVKPMGIVWDGQDLWAVNRPENGGLVKLSKNGKILQQWNLAGPFCYGLTFDGRYMWYAETNLRWIFQVDPRTGEMI